MNRQVNRLVVDFQLQYLEILWQLLLHDANSERWVGAEAKTVTFIRNHLNMLV